MVCVLINEKICMIRLLCNISQQELSELLQVTTKTNIALVSNKKNSLDIIDKFSNIIYEDDYPFVFADIKRVKKCLHLKKAQIITVYDRKTLNRIKCKKTKIKDTADISYENFRTSTYKQLLTKENDRQCLSFDEYMATSSFSISFCYDNFIHLENIYRIVKQSKKLYINNIKNRKDLLHLLNNPSYCSISIFVKNKYGDFGLVGFLAYENETKHIYEFIVDDYYKELCFEYVVLNYFDLDASNFIDCKKYVNLYSVIPYEQPRNTSVLFKGPCDVRSIWEQFSTECRSFEFTYTNLKGISIESINHFSIVKQAIELSDDQIKEIEKEIPFIDSNTFSKKIIETDYDVIVLSVLTDANLGVYVKKNNEYTIVFGEKCRVLSEKNRKKWLAGKYNASNYKFDDTIYNKFLSNFRPIKATTPQELVEYIKFIRNVINKKTKLILIGGVERSYNKCFNRNYIFRNILHYRYRIAIEKNLISLPNTYIISINDYILDQNDFRGHYNHFVRDVYYNLSIDLIETIKDDISNDIKLKLY